MINRGIVRKSMCEVWRATLLFGLGMAAFHALLSYVIPTLFAKYSEQLLQIEFVRPIITALLGAEIGSRLDPRVMSSFVWVHPVVLALLWAQEITFCARMPAGEIDRGTIDTFLALPVSRWRVYMSESVVFLACGLFLVLMGLIGNQAGGWLSGDGDYRMPTMSLLKVIVNLYGIYVAVGGLAFLVSACCDRGGSVVGIVFAAVLASFLLNFLAQLWQPAKGFAFLSVMHYYKPLVIVREAAWPVWNLSVLTAVGVALWLLGGRVFSTRDICTV